MNSTQTPQLNWVAQATRLCRPATGRTERREGRETRRGAHAARVPVWAARPNRRSPVCLLPGGKKLVERGFRRAAENSTPAACAPRRAGLRPAPPAEFASGPLLRASVGSAKRVGFPRGRRVLHYSHNSRPVLDFGRTPSPLLAQLRHLLFQIGNTLFQGLFHSPSFTQRYAASQSPL